MATETKQQSASPDNNDTAEIKVGGDIKPAGSRGPRKLKLKPSRSIAKKVFIGLVVLVIIAAGFWLLYGKSHHLGEKVYAQAAGHKIYKEDIVNLIGKNKGISDHDAAEVLANKYLYEAMAKQDGLTVTDKDIQIAYGSSIQRQKNENKYAYQFQVNELYYNKLQNYTQGVYKGYLLVAHFSRNIALQPQAQSSFPTNDGNQAAIDADKKYAKDFITKLYNQIESHKITWDQAAQMEKADPRIGTNMYSLTHSGPFDTSKATNSLLVPYSAMQQINKLKAGQTSRPFAVTVTTTVGSSNDSFESYFLVVRLDSKYGGGSYMSTLQKIDQAKDKLGYKIYV